MKCLQLMMYIHERKSSTTHCYIGLSLIYKYANTRQQSGAKRPSSRVVCLLTTSQASLRFEALRFEVRFKRASSGLENEALQSEASTAL